MEVSGQLHTPVALPLGKEPPVPTESTARWTPSHSGCSSKEKNLSPSRESNAGCPAPILVSVY